MGSVYYQEPSTDGAPGIWDLDDALRFQALGKWPWSPSLLFSNGEQGGLYDPSDLTTLFQDANGTTPALPGDPVGLVLDKSGNSRNLSQPTTAARPTLQSPGLRFDLADDALTTVLPPINGDILIAGRNGTIIEPVSYAAGSTFSLGPRTYTGGTPGVLAALGDIVGVLLIDRTLSALERDNLIAYYKKKGAKGLLVPGPELVVNGTFATNLDGWNDISAGSGTASYDDGSVRLQGTSGGNLGRISQNLSLIPGRVYIVSTNVKEVSSGMLVGGITTIGNLSGFNVALFNATSPGEYPIIFAPTVTSAYIAARTAESGGVGSIEEFSLRELRAQEDWT